MSLTIKKKKAKRAKTHTHTLNRKPTAEIFFYYSSCILDGHNPAKRGTQKPKTKVSSFKQPKIHIVIHH